MQTMVLSFCLHLNRPTLLACESGQMLYVFCNGHSTHKPLHAARHAKTEALRVLG